MTTSFQLSAAAYSIYSQLPYISGGRLLHPQPEDAPYRGHRDPHNYCTFNTSHRVQNGSTAHPASHTMGTSGFSPGSKAAGA